MTAARWYNALWRWHFYAGVFCVPFVLWLALTGAVYTWRPQIEALTEARYDRIGPLAARTDPHRQVAAAIGAMPGARFVRYELPQTQGAAARVIVARGEDETRVFVDPYRARVLGSIAEAWRPMPLVSRLHGTLLLGRFGSWLVELAACWALVMLATGLYLWWPRGQGPAGVVWPRLRARGRRFWRDLHAVSGFWVSLAAMFLILTGLPWADAWGRWFAAMRETTGLVAGPQPWTVGGRALPDAHAAHDMPGHAAGYDPAGLDHAVAAAWRLSPAPPVTVTPRDGLWRVQSQAADRPLRSEATIDGATGAILARRGFADGHPIDRAVGYGIAAHEGQLFGLANQLATTLTALLLVVLAASGTVMWWRRRLVGRLGAPIATMRLRYGAALVAGIAALGIALPLFGASLLAVIGFERVARRHSATRRWLGLAG